MERSIMIYNTLKNHEEIEFQSLTVSGVEFTLDGYLTTIEYIPDPIQYVAELKVTGVSSQILSAYTFKSLLEDFLIPVLNSELSDAREELEKQKELLRVESKMEAMERVYYFLSINYYSYPDLFWEILEELGVPEYLERISEASNWIVSNNYSGFLDIYQDNKEKL